MTFTGILKVEGQFLDVQEAYIFRMLMLQKREGGGNKFL
jgi:hypothetical protein